MQTMERPAATPSPAIETLAVDYVVYNVSDLNRSIEFYRDVRGLPFDYVYEGVWAEFNVQPVSIALCGPPWAEAPQAGYRGGATVALAVADVPAALEALRARGVPVLLERQESPVCFFATIA